jgi:hypothetical protein
MLSVKASQESFRKEIKLIYEMIKEEGKPSSLEYRGGWVKLTLWLEGLASIAFLFGTILLLVFIGKNFPI